ncbi:MAG: protein kinase [Burkholderiales bacterium]
MPLEISELQWLSRLLDQVLDLPEVEREQWLANLSGEDARFGPTLRDLLAKRETLETVELLAPMRALAGLDAAEPDGTVGPYRLERMLAQGGMGEVWLASRADGALKRKVAVKLPYVTHMPGLAERFEREREILGTLDHPHIARLYDAGFDARGRPFMALEYVEGQPITDYCSEKNLTVPARLELLLQVAEAVAFAHSRLVLHRDLKPGNILVTGDGQVRLLDFGIAKLMAEGRAQETALTQAAGRALTLDYASPEQIRGDTIGTASDVYSLGVVAYELLTGVRPYRLNRGTAAELEEAITAQDVPLASSVAATARARALLRGDLDAILNKALKKQAAERYATIDALAQDLRRSLAGERVLARPDTLASRAVRFARRHRVPLVAAAIVAAAFVLALGFGATAVVILVLLAGLGASAWQAKRAREQARIAGMQARKAEAVKRFLLDIFNANSLMQGDPQKAQRTTARELLDIGVSRIDGSLRDEPESRTELLDTLGGLYYELGLRTDAARLRLLATELARNTFGPRDVRFARIAVACAQSIEESAQRSQVLGLLEEADAALVAAGESESAQRGALLRNLAAYYRHESLPDFVRTADEAVPIAARLGEDPETSNALSNALRIAGRARIVTGEFDLAEQRYRRAVEVPGPKGEIGNVWRVNAHAELAEALVHLGRFEESEREARAARDISVKGHGDRHRWTLVVKARLANLLVDFGKVEEAAVIWDEIAQALADDRPEYDEQFRSDIASYRSAPLVIRGRPDLSEPFQRADREDLARYFANSYALAVREAELADVALTYGRYDEARALLAAARERWQAYARGLGASSPTACSIAASEARLALAQGDLAQARACVDAVVQPATAAQGRFTKRALGLAVERAEVEFACGNFRRARELADREFRALREAAGAYRLLHPEAVLLLVRGRASLALGDRAAATADLRDALALRHSHDDPASLWLAQVLVALAECAAGEEPRELVAHARGIYAQHPPLGPHVVAPLERIASAMT